MPAAYLLGLLFVAAAMVLLPLLYLALIGASVWAVFWWATYEVLDTQHAKVLARLTELAQLH